MNRFKIIDTEVKGSLRVLMNSQYNRVNATSVTIAENVTVRLFGVVKRKLIIKKGARVYLHGTVLGKVENSGGELHIHE
jgi:hypothetical protein